MKAARLILATLMTFAAVQMAHAGNKGGGTTTTTATTKTPSPGGPVPVPYPNAAKSNILKSKHDTSKNSISNIK
jgi:hypothetical protein